MNTREAIVSAGDWGPSRNSIAMKLHYKYFFLRADGKWVACLGDTKSVEQLVSLRSKGVEVIVIRIENYFRSFSTLNTFIQHPMFKLGLAEMIALLQFNIENWGTTRWQLGAISSKHKQEKHSDGDPLKPLDHPFQSSLKGVSTLIEFPSRGVGCQPYYQGIQIA